MPRKTSLVIGSRIRETPTTAQALGLRERKKAELKRRIEQVTLDLIRRRGYERTTIEEIVRRVDISQPTFYKYYPSKDAILREHTLSGLARLLQHEHNATGTSVTRMRRFFQGMASQMTAERHLWYAIAVSNAYNPIRDPELLRANQAGTRVIEAVIAAGQRQGEFTRAYSARRLSSLLEGIMFRVCLEWGADFPRAHALPAALDEGFDLFLRAARPRAGDKPLAKRALGR